MRCNRRLLEPQVLIARYRVEQLFQVGAGVQYRLELHGLSQHFGVIYVDQLVVKLFLELHEVFGQWSVEMTKHEHQVGHAIVSYKHFSRGQ